MGVVLSDAEKSLKFFMGILEYAIFPHVRSPVFAKSCGVLNRNVAWEWVAGQTKKNVMDENWPQAPNLSKIADIFARTFTLMGKSRSPLYISKMRAEEWFDIPIHEASHP